MEATGKTHADADFAAALVEAMHSVTVEGLTGTMTWDETREPNKAAKAMEKLNISEIEAMDKEFDPNLMNAVQQVPMEGKESGTVVQVFQKGYKLGDKIIRHATVVVAE